jgi:ABC-2 type transport system ATP-binding protein
MVAKLTGTPEFVGTPADLPEIVLQTLELRRCFDQFTAVDDLNIYVRSGEVFGLLGPNGAGKSTVIKILTTLLPPTSGRAYLAGYDVTRQPNATRRVVGYVPQALSADGTLTGYENLLIIAKIYDIPSRHRKQRIREMLEFMGLESVAHRLVRTYSGGMIRKLEIAQAILHQPRILFLDEPTVGLDPVARSQVWQLMEQLRKEHGTTIFLTTHFLEEADALCDRVAIMNRGKEIITGSPLELKASINKPDASLDDVFIHYAGNQLISGVSYSETARTRRATQRLG